MLFLRHRAQESTGLQLTKNRWCSVIKWILVVVPEDLNLPAQLGVLQRKALPCMFEKTANSVLCPFSAHVYS